ncbi:TPA: pyridoxal kinase, partial [Pseudomonas aeruginosa]|nr:pyridoxal kinase [Pseudomonas aeruginosa]
MPRTPHLLAIQSHVVFGHAGNAAAVFPMQRIGINVWPLNTVQFSNHTQYGQWTGQVLPPEQIPALVDGIAGIGELGNCDAVLSGYLGSAAQGRAILDVVARIKQ